MERAKGRAWLICWITRVCDPWPMRHFSHVCFNKPQGTASPEQAGTQGACLRWRVGKVLNKTENEDRASDLRITI